MEDRAVVDYPFYLAGCHKLGWTPLAFDEFRDLYRCYLKARDASFDPASENIAQPLATMIYRLHPAKIRYRYRVRKQLHFLETAIQRGLSGNGPDGTVIGATILPVPPTRFGSAAQEFPLPDQP